MRVIRLFSDNDHLIWYFRYFNLFPKYPNSNINKKAAPLLNKKLRHNPLKNDDVSQRLYHFPQTSTSSALLPLSLAGYLLRRLLHPLDVRRTVRSGDGSVRHISPGKGNRFAWHRSSRPPPRHRFRAGANFSISFLQLRFRMGLLDHRFHFSHHLLRDLYNNSLQFLVFLIYFVIKNRVLM